MSIKIDTKASNRICYDNAKKMFNQMQSVVIRSWLVKWEHMLIHLILVAFDLNCDFLTLMVLKCVFESNALAPFQCYMENIVKRVFPSEYIAFDKNTTNMFSLPLMWVVGSRELYMLNIVALRPPRRSYTKSHSNTG